MSSNQSVKILEAMQAATQAMIDQYMDISALEGFREDGYNQTQLAEIVVNLINVKKINDHLMLVCAINKVDDTDNSGEANQ